MGDVKLSAFLGAGLGVSVIVAMFVGFFVAFVPAALLLRPARQGGAQAGDPARALPRTRRRRRALLGRRDTRLVQAARGVSAARRRTEPQGRRAESRYCEVWKVPRRLPAFRQPIDAHCWLLPRGKRQPTRRRGRRAREVDRRTRSRCSTTRCAGVMPSVFVLEHGRLLARRAARVLAVVPDGSHGSRAGSRGARCDWAGPSWRRDVTVDPDYVAALPGVVSELAVPLRAGRVVVGVAQRRVRARATGRCCRRRCDRSLRALRRVVEALRASRTLDLAALARLFVHLGSLREAGDIAALGARRLSEGTPGRGEPDRSPGTSSASPQPWQSGVRMRRRRHRSAQSELEAAHVLRPIRASSARCSTSAVLADAPGSGASIVWLPLRANGEELGALVGRSRAPTTRSDRSSTRLPSSRRTSRRRSTRPSLSDASGRAP